MKQKMSKTILSVVLTALLIFSTAVPAFADTGAMTLNGITYTYDTDTKTAAVSGYDYSLSGDVTIESTINVDGVDYSVTSIGDGAFYECSSLTSIVIPNSVTSIGDYAFYWCSNLTSIEIPNSVTSIGDGAFDSCDSLTSIEIPGSVTSIGDGAFDSCDSLTSIEIPGSVTSIGDYTFYHCMSLTSIEIPNSVTSIGDCAFFFCRSLTSIEIPNSVTSIGDNAFFFCQSLTSIEIPEGVTSIGNNIFYDCGSLTSIVIPNSVTSIGDYAFMGCSSLTDAYIPVNASLGTDLFAYTYQPINVWYYEVLKGAEESPDGKTHVAITALKDKNGAAITEPRVIQDGAMGYGYVIDEVRAENLSLDHMLTKIEAKEPTCEDVGYEAYWKCEFCGTLYSDENGDNEIAAPIEIPALGHSLIKVDGKEPTCEDVGYEAYWKCEFCGTLYSDENGDNEIATPIEIPALGHSLIKVEGKEPTCEDVGYKTYWKCEFCDKYFSDENATTEITLDDTVIKAAGHDYKDGKCTVCEAIDPDFKAVIIEGANGEWQKGTEDGLSFTSNAAFAHFLKVQVDGKDLDASDYTVKEGSTIVTLKAEYLETLSVGKHTLAIVSETGTAETEFTIKAAAVADDTQSPQTGDESNIALWIAVMLAAGTALTGTVLYNRKRKYSR